MTKTFKIDASGKKIGRVATEVAVLLMGKNEPSFARNKVADVLVKVENASKISIDPKKMSNKRHLRYSGYPGGLKSRKLSETIKIHGYAGLFKKAVSGMLPDNKLKPILIKKLIVTE